MENTENIIEINTDDVIKPTESTTLYESRKNVYSNILPKNVPKASIVIIGYNRSQKTKRCVECVLKYTKNIDFELILIDNGSTDDTLEYYKQVKHANKKIIHVTKNAGVVLTMNISMQMFNGEYYVLLPNDAYVTKNWLSNLIKCYESDDKIGFVTPMSSNISNLQQPNLQFKDFDDMQAKAAKFNISDPKKWHERLRLINIVTVLKREIIDNIGVFDLGFFHDFGEDDYSKRIRRMGYKLMLCCDTFVHHDHDFSRMEDKDPKKHMQSINTGRQNYKDKYKGLDGWDDINNFEPTFIQNIQPPTCKCPNILGIDVRCGTPILEIQNKLKEFDVFTSNTYAYTTGAKYFADLQFICNDVKCDRIEFLTDYYAASDFDYIFLGEPINTYTNPLVVVQKLYEFLKPNGVLMFKLRNTSDLRNFFYSIGNSSVDREQSMPVSIAVDDMHMFLKAIKVKHVSVISENHEINTDLKTYIQRLIESMGYTNDIKETLNRITTNNYLFYVKK